MTKKTKTYPLIGAVNYYPRRQKNIRLSLKNSEIRISYPRNMGFRRAENFLRSKTDWILKNKKEAWQPVDNSAIGRQHVLKLADNCLRPRIERKIIHAPRNCLKQIENLIKKALKDEAETYLAPLIDACIKKTNLKPQKIRIRYMKTQWGSCTSRNHVALNSALIYLPDDLITYVVTHELCHLQVLNHSSLFWQLVTRHIPDYQQLKTKLKQYPINLVVRQPECRL